jgi:UDP-4-amino-4,6-dideoxy-N-acetyl-beta-L-altrosamine transaminase
MKKTYSYGRQTIGNDDIQAVIEVLQSDWMTQGPAIEKFEDSLKDKFGGKYCSAVANGTAGLHLIAIGLGWKKGDIVLTVPNTFLSSANCILYVGATPDFVDINPDTYTIDINKLEEKILFYRNSNKSIKAVVAVDYAGQPCNWQALKDLSIKYGFQLVNDNCHALGAEYKGDTKYAVEYADAVNLSFHPVKHITTGEGGAVLTNNIELDEKIKILRTHGMTKDEKYLEKNDGPWYYEMCMLGFNYRITDFQCALGTSQLSKLEAFVKRRREIAEYYNLAFRGIENLQVPQVADMCNHAYHLYPLRVKHSKLKLDKKELFAKLKDKGIIGQVHYIPVHLQPYYKNNFGFKKGDYPVSENHYEEEISIPVYPSLTDKDLKYIAGTIIEIVNGGK